MVKEVPVQQLNKALSFLKDMQFEINKNSGKVSGGKIKEICDTHGVSYLNIKASQNIGVFGKVKTNCWKTFVQQVEPFHARKLVLMRRKMHAENQAITRTKTKRITRKFTVRTIKTKLKNEPELIIKPNRKQNRIFSIFWGLIKFKF